MGRSGRIVAMLLALVAWVACLTGVWLAMRAVMGVGGSCASGGAYQVQARCPAGSSWLLFAGSLVGVLALWVYVVANRPLPGPRLQRLAWCALFVTMGWNFLQFALAPPPPVTVSTETAVVWVMCGLLFVALGGVPLVVWLGVPSQRRAILWADAGAPPSHRSLRSPVSSDVLEALEAAASDGEVTGEEWREVGESLAPVTGPPDRDYADPSSGKAALAAAQAVAVVVGVVAGSAISTALMG